MQQTRTAYTSVGTAVSIPLEWLLLTSLKGHLLIDKASHSQVQVKIIAQPGRITLIPWEAHWAAHHNWDLPNSAWFTHQPTLPLHLAMLRRPYYRHGNSLQYTVSCVPSLDMQGCHNPFDNWTAATKCDVIGE